MTGNAQASEVLNECCFDVTEEAVKRHCTVDHRSSIDLNYDLK